MLTKYPSSEFANVTPKSRDNDQINESLDLSSIAVSNGAQRYEFDLTGALERIAVARAQFMFLSARGKRAFDLQVPIYDTPIGTVTGAVYTQKSHAVGANEVLFNGYEPAIGDFIQFAGHSKVYGIEYVQDGTATIFPPLYKTVALNEAVNVNNLTFRVRRTSNIQTLETNKGQLAVLVLMSLRRFKL